jgi:hypothetical protein
MRFGARKTTMQTPVTDTPLQQILTAVVPLVVTLLGVVGSWLIAAVRSKVKSEQARGMLLRLSEQASDVVLELEQGAVAKLRDLSADGKLDAGDIAQLKELSIKKFKQQLGARGKADALKVLGFKDEAELEAVLRAKLESELAKARATIGTKVKGAIETPAKSTELG